MNILVIRLSAIGDIFLSTCLLPLLKSLYPGCQITWLTEPVGATILEGHPLLDRVLTLPRKELTRALKSGRLIAFSRSFGRLCAALREEHFDLIIDPQGLMKSSIWSRLAKGDLRIGMHGREGSSVFYDTLIRLPEKEQRLILAEHRELALRLGANPGEVAMRLHVGEANQKAADAFLSENNVPRPILFCPFTTRPQKHWFDEDWGKLGDYLSERGIGPLVILGGPVDGEQARNIAGLMRSAPVIAAGESRPVGFALGILSRSRGLVGVDTGLTHAGIAFDRPTVALFGSTRPYVETGSPRNRVLYHEMECAPCNRRPTCGGRFDCMRRHVPSTVGEQLVELIDL